MIIKSTDLPKKMITTLYNTIADKKIAFLGWAFKKDTNDTRESAAIYVAEHLLQEQANIVVYDPKVTEEQIYSDLEYLGTLSSEDIMNRVTVVNDPYRAMDNAHAVAVLTEWDEFKSYDWYKVYESMMKPAFVFDGRRLLEKDKMEGFGFKLYTIGR